MPDAQAPRLLCVEVHEGRPLSYMTETAAALLAELGRRAPLRARPRPAPASSTGASTCPGPAPALRDLRQRRPPAGGRRVRPGLARAPSPTGSPPSARRSPRCAAHLARTADPAWLRKDRVAEDLFAYLVVERALLPGGAG